MRYNNPPVYITENGVSSNVAPEASLDQALDDASRIRYISGYLKSILGAIQGGADVRGYFYWSIFDNFEWAEGSWYALRAHPRGPPWHVWRQMGPTRQEIPGVLPSVHDWAAQ